MSTGNERVARLLDLSVRLDGDPPTRRDLELLGHLNIRIREVAEQILWENRNALLGAFEALVAALEGPDPAPAAVEWEDSLEGEEPQVQEVAESALDPSPEARFQRLLHWRGEHEDGAVAAVSDQDLARLASSRADTVAEVERAVARLRAQAVVARYAADLSFVLSGVTPEAAPEPTEEPEPAAVSEPEPQSPAPSWPAGPDPQADEFAPFVFERLTQFAPYAWSATPATASGLVSAELVDGVTRLHWTPAPDTGQAVTLYRIVESTTGWPSGAPELGSLVGVTQATSGSLKLRGNGPVTYLAIWANRGASLLEASHSQPVLIGTGQIVWPPHELSAQVTPHRTVAALLSVPQGSRVEVQRFLKGQTISYDTFRELDRGQVSPTGFRDLEPPMGEDIVYAAFCVAELTDGSSVVSSPVTVEVHITPEVQRVDVQVTASSVTPGAYDISWIPPRHGRVVVYATPERPPVGLENEPRTAEIIEGQGLSQQYRISYPPTDLGGLMTIRDVAVDPSWVRAHFVAVHWVSDESVWVGSAVSMVTPRAPEHAEIVERVDAQVITFAWPSGVTVVQAYQGPRGQGLDPQGSEPIAQLTSDEYVQMGGMRITRTLPSNGCAIHLFGVVYLDGQPIYSSGVPIDYPGMTRLKYQVLPYGADGNPAQPGQWPARYRIYAEVDDDLHETPIAVVAQPGRLPLHPQDGRTFRQVNVSLRAGISTFVTELDAGPVRAFVRLFVDLPPAQTGSVAVLDPSVYTLDVSL